MPLIFSLLDLIKDLSVKWALHYVVDYKTGQLLVMKSTV